jgi:O-antigen/teichoic acid export membrane protein
VSESGADSQRAPQGPAHEDKGFLHGVAWNLASLAFLALAGFALNIAIGRLYGPADLGLFNVCFALLIFLSQFGAFGLQFSALQAVAHRAGREPEAARRTASAALVAAAALSTIVALAGWVGAPLLASFFSDPRFMHAWLLLLPGLWAFSINKVLFGIVNGGVGMRIFAVLQAMRYVLILGALVCLVATHAPGEQLTLVFTVAELILLPMLLAAVPAVVGPWTVAIDDVRWHLWFGARGFLSGAVLELNTRVDVLIIGAMLDTARAGLYSMALLVAEGVGQVIFVVRNNVNPALTRMIAEGRHAEITAFSRRVGLAVTAGLAGLSVVALAIYPLFVDWILGDGRYHEAFWPLAVLLAGFTVTAAPQTFGMILTQAGRPGLHTFYVVSILVVNALGNWLLVPRLGLLGASVATAASYVYGSVALALLARRVLGLRLFG